MKLSKKERKARDAAANEVCWTVVLMMHLGMLELPTEDRPLLAEPMQKWADIAMGPPRPSAAAFDGCWCD